MIASQCKSFQVHARPDQTRWQVKLPIWLEGLKHEIHKFKTLLFWLAKLLEVLHLSYMPLSYMFMEYNSFYSTEIK